MNARHPSWFACALMASAIFAVQGCAAVLSQSLVNRSLEAGVTATDPAVIDGDMKTGANVPRIDIQLARLQYVNRIVIHTERGVRLTDVEVERVRGERTWDRVIVPPKTNKGPVIVVPIQGVAQIAGVRLYLWKGAKIEESRQSFMYGDPVIIQTYSRTPVNVYEVQLLGLGDDDGSAFGSRANSREPNNVEDNSE